MLSRRRFVHGAMAAAVGASFAGRAAWSAILGPSLRVDRDIDAVTGDGASVTLARASVQELGESLRGNLVLPGHPVYDEARRVINAQMNRFPALIVQPRGAADVKSALDFARDSNLLVAVKCGGHSPSGKSTCDGGMQIDLSLMRGVNVDPAARVAHVAGGSLLGDMDHETMARGLVTTAGTVSHTGVGGLSLGGGFGRVARRFGLALDNIRAVEIVTPQGEYLHASPEENADLYWGVRGGGGNFGVVTAFEFGLHPMEREVVGGTIAFPLEQARQVLRFYSEFEATAPDELYLSGGLVSNVGISGVGFSICYSGSLDRAEQYVNAIRSAGTPIFDDVGLMDYVSLQRSGDISEPRAIGSYTKTGFVESISPSLIDAMIDGFEEHPERMTNMAFQHCGGAISRVADDATAFPHRGIHVTALLLVDWPVEIDPTRHIDWLQQYWASVEPHTDGFYTNDVVDETQSQVDENYLHNYPRLLELKNRYDPTNLLRLNANIVPTA
ncbi:MAG TPA: FAD-binding protein [Gammaproteobacteria bacterium]|nr:FAD-binding protein [Gammaproteobacteria bacterium]